MRRFGATLPGGRIVCDSITSPGGGGREHYGTPSDLDPLSLDVISSSLGVFAVSG